MKRFTLLLAVLVAAAIACGGAPVDPPNDETETPQVGTVEPTNPIQITAGPTRCVPVFVCGPTPTPRPATITPTPTDTPQPTLTPTPTDTPTATPTEGIPTPTRISNTCPYGYGFLSGDTYFTPFGFNRVRSQPIVLASTDTGRRMNAGAETTCVYYDDGGNIWFYVEDVSGWVAYILDGVPLGTIVRPTNEATPIGGDEE